MSITKGYVQVSDGQIHYQTCGRGEKVLVLLHQTASSSNMYRALMPLLEQDFKMIALDTPGFGQSFVPDQQPSTADYVSWLTEALNELDVQSFHLLGHHTGAAFACEIAAKFPQRVESLAMVGPVYLSESERQSWKEAAIDPMFISSDGAHLMKIWDRVTGLDPSPSSELCHREAIDTLTAGERWHWGYVAVFDQDFPNYYKMVSCPILIMCGKDDVLWPYFGAACEARPDATSVEVPGGTYVVDDYPEAVAANMKSFIC